MKWVYGSTNSPSTDVVNTTKLCVCVFCVEYGLEMLWEPIQGVADVTSHH